MEQTLMETLTLDLMKLDDNGYVQKMLMYQITFTLLQKSH